MYSLKLTLRVLLWNNVKILRAAGQHTHTMTSQKYPPHPSKGAKLCAISLFRSRLVGGLGSCGRIVIIDRSNRLSWHDWAFYNEDNIYQTSGNVTA